MSTSFVRTGLHLALVAGGLAASAPALAQATVYCCIDAQNRKVCSDFLPPECNNREYQLYDQQGFKMGPPVPAPLTKEQQARRDAEIARKAEAERLKIEERRRNQALLATYASEKDIDAARDRAFADVDKTVGQAEKALAEATARLGKIEKEKEFYKNKPLPPQVKSSMDTAEKDIANKKQALEDRKAERVKVSEKYEQEKLKYRELKSGKETPSEPPKPKREVVVQPNEGAAGEMGKGAPPAAAGQLQPSQNSVNPTPTPAGAPTAAPPPAPAAGR